MKKIMILVSILAVPGFLYYLLTVGGKNRYKPLPIYGPKQLSGTYHKYHGKKIPDTLYHQVQDFNLTDQNGRRVSFNSLEGRILVVSFFYTHGADMTSRLNANMDTLAKYLTKNKLITLVSVTVDPARDTQAALKNYSRQFGRPDSKWLFLTGDTSIIYPLARKGLLVDAVQSSPDNFIYTNKFILLDPEHRIRGYYTGTDVAEVNRLGDELKVQIAEELRKVKAPN